MIVSYFGDARFYVNDNGQPEVRASEHLIGNIYPGTLIYLTVPINIPEADEEDLEW
jgi:hypothetical protein